MPRLDTEDGGVAHRQVDEPESNNVTFTLSTPTSPTSYRRPRPGMSRRGSMEALDERSPLLQTSRSHMRIHNTYDSMRVPNLSRNHSYTGQCGAKYFAERRTNMFFLA